MRIQFESTALENKSEWRFLRKILELIDDEKHEWHVVDPDTIEASPWFERIDHSFKELFRKAAMASTRFYFNPTDTQERRLHSRVLIIGAHAPPQSLTPEKAHGYLSEPLKIMVENRITDVTFLRAVLERLADPEIPRLIKVKAIVFESDGGNGGLKNLILQKIKEWEFSEMPWRAIVVTDSDTRIYKKEFSGTPKEIHELCNSHGIECFVLKKRAIENYVPNAVIEEYYSVEDRKKLRKTAETFCNMNDEARDYFPVKTALRTTGNKVDPLELSKYREILPDADFQTLCDQNFHGFDKYFIKILLVEDGSKLRDSLTADALRKRDGCGELDDLVQCIERMV